MRLSIIICTRNRVDHLMKCLRSVMHAIERSGLDDLEIIVVNNGSTDETEEKLLQIKKGTPIHIRIVNEPQKGLARARNAGLNAARGELIVFTDDDCLMSDDYITNALRYDHADDTFVLRGGRIELGDPSDLPLTIKTDMNARHWSLQERSARHENLTGVISGCNMMFRRSLYKKLGDFDIALGAGTKIPGADDTDYIVRAYLAGCKIEYTPDLVVHHYHGRRTPSDARQLMVNYLRGSGALYMKYLFRSIDIVRPFVWDVRNRIAEIRTGENKYLPQYGLSYRDVLRENFRGMFDYAFREKVTANETNKKNEDFTDLRQKISECLDRPGNRSQKFALLDFPHYANVGDSLIWCGEICFFKRVWGSRPSYVSTYRNFSAGEFRKAVPFGPIFLQGGGNFGDLWEEHQNFREKIIAEFHDRRIIQLPQSIHFKDQSRLAKAACIINAHPDFILLVRDQQSFEIARSSFTCQVEMCPDMAFFLDPIKKRGKANRDLLMLLRTDHEKSDKAKSGFEGLPPVFAREDWNEDAQGFDQRTRLETIFLLPFARFLAALNKNVRREYFYERLAKKRIQRGVSQLSSARFIITDRLHVHILCLLLKIPHVILDNSYGKIKNFSAAWIKNDGTFSATETLDLALNDYEERGAK